MKTGECLAFVLLIMALLLAACGETVASATPTATPTVVKNLFGSPFPPYKTPTPLPTQTPRPTYISPPTSTPTTTAIIEGSRVTWQPNEILIYWGNHGGDGDAISYPPDFMLFWDGTLLQAGSGFSSPPYISHTSQKEICKLFLTINQSGFFEEQKWYSMPFDGLGGGSIQVNAWKTNTVSSQVLDYAIKGSPYYTTLFCRFCPLPDINTIIRPPMANVYFLLDSFVPENREIASTQDIVIYLGLVDDKPGESWPISSVSLENLWDQCSKTSCTDVGMVVTGEMAREIQEKITNGYYSTLDNKTISVLYRPVWPKPSSVPLDYIITCNLEDDTFPILPLSTANSYWYYSPSGKWGAEVIEDTGEGVGMHVVSIYGDEKTYYYDPTLFGQEAVKVFPRFWTADNQFFLANILPGDFVPFSEPFVDSIGLQRIDVQNGLVSYLFIGTNGQKFSYAISRDGTKVAYIRQGDSPLRIGIKTISTGEEQSATLTPPLEYAGHHYERAGTILWSPDGNYVYVAATFKADTPISPRAGHILQINTGNLSNMRAIFTNALEVGLMQYLPATNAHICPLGADFESYCPTILNLETGEIFR